VGKEPPHPPKVGEAAPDFELADLDGKAVSLKKLAAEKPVVLVVLRGWPGYQCPLCSRQVGEFLAKKAELDKHGAAVVLVYPGPADSLADHAKEFEEQGKWDLPANFHYVTDPDYKFTNAWGLRWEATRETAYPSTFVIGKDQKIKFAKTSTTHGDRAAAATVLEELAKLE
jgi:peroxiredoxin